MNDKIKVLFYTELWANAGIESVIMSLFRNFDLTKVSVDIMASQNLSDFYDDEIAALDGRKIITLEKEYSSPAQRMVANRNAFRKALEENRYDVVHLHMCNAASMVYGKIAKEIGIPVVVYHSHNTNLSTKMRHIKTLVHNICKWRYEKYADALFSCSDLASRWMFTNKSVNNGKVLLIKNAIDLDKFSFDLTGRKEFREKIGAGEKMVIGHIGRFAVAKNHSFLIDVYEAFHRKYSNSLLLLIGEGDDEAMVRKKVADLGLNDSVIFYGTTNEIPQALWAMDAFVLPSLFEGNPVVGIEAQAASTPCFFADTITKMCQLTENVQYLSLTDDSPEKWAEAVYGAISGERDSVKTVMQNKGYDIKKVARYVQSIYKAEVEKK